MTNEVILIIGLLFFLAVAAVVLLGIALRKNDELREKNEKYIEMNSALHLQVDNLLTEASELQKSCEDLANENAVQRTEIEVLQREKDYLRGANAAWKEKYKAEQKKVRALEGEVSRLRNCSFGVMMRDWERIEDEGRVYYEKDKLRLIVEDDKVVGWYRPEAETAEQAEATAEEPEEVTDAVNRAEK